MFDALKNTEKNNINDSFINTYRFWANILVIAVFINFLFFRTLFINDNSFIYAINYLIDYGVFIAFYLLLFYKFYNYLFNSKIKEGVLGILFLIEGTLKLYINDINIYNIVELSFFILTFIIALKTLLPIIFLKNIKELKRGLYIFVFTALISSNLNYILLSSNKLIDRDIMHYASLYLSSYMEKVSSISFIIILTAYIVNYIPIKTKGMYKYFILALFIAIFIIVLKTQSLLIIVSFYNALGVGLHFPFYLYVVLIIMFLLALLSYLISSIINKKYSSEFTALTLFILAGLDISGFSLRLISIFAIIELNNIKNKL